jgi:hypothetical protein
MLMYDVSQSPLSRVSPSVNEEKVAMKMFRESQSPLSRVIPFARVRRQA